MQETLYQTADAGDSFIRCLIESLLHQMSEREMQVSLYQTADAEVSPSDSGCRRHSIRQRMQKSLYQTADARDTLSDIGCRRHSIS